MLIRTGGAAERSRGEGPAGPGVGRTIATLAVWVAGSLALACVVAPPVYSGLLTAFDGFTVPYSRVFNRVAMLVGIGALWALRGGIEPTLVADAWRREKWGQRARRAAAGVLLAFVPALLVLPLVVAGGEVRWSPEPPVVNAIRLVRSIPGAILASGMEEAFFRVILFGGMALRGSVALAAVTSSAFYAVIHFLAPRHDFVYPGWSPYVGFDYFGPVLAAYGNPTLVPGLAGLVVIGLALCAAYRLTGSFALCVGIHAGWFMAAKGGVHLLQIVPGAPSATTMGKRMYLIGHPWTWVAVVATTVMVFLYIQSRTGRQ